MLIVVRHGRTAVNAGTRLQGRMDAPLDELGIRQAHVTGEWVRARWDVREIVSSPLVRAFDTASAIGGDVRVDDSFVELDYGDWDGLPLADVPRGEWERWRSDPSFRPPNGETLLELDERVAPAVDALLERARTEDIVVVSHVSPIKSIVTRVLRAGPEMTWRMSLDRASICTVSVGPNGPSLSSFNETGHLRDLRG